MTTVKYTLYKYSINHISSITSPQTIYKTINNQTISLASTIVKWYVPNHFGSFLWLYYTNEWWPWRMVGTYDFPFTLSSNHTWLYLARLSTCWPHNFLTARTFGPFCRFNLGHRIFYYVIYLALKCTILELGAVDRRQLRLMNSLVVAESSNWPKASKKDWPVYNFDNTA